MFVNSKMFMSLVKMFKNFKKHSRFSKMFMIEKKTFMKLNIFLYHEYVSKSQNRMAVLSS